MKIIDRATEFDLQNEKDKVIHGHTSIVLKNVKTGLVERVESDNVFQTKAVAGFMRSLGRAGRVLTAESSLDTGYSWKNILGGILLFESQITPADDTVHYAPVGNKMVGNGAYGVVNSATPTELGSYNSVESSESSSAITQVYDFNTSQANGTISCVCLTSAAGGYIGYGNASGGAAATRKYFSDGMSANNVGSGLVGFRDNYKYSFAYSQPTLTITKTFVPITRGSIKSGIGQTITLDLSGIGNPTDIARAWHDGQYLYFAPHQVVADSGTLTYYKYDTATDTITQESITNSTGESLNTSYGFFVANDLLFIVSTANTKTFAIEPTTSALVNEFNFRALGASRYIGGYTLLSNASGNPVMYNNNATTYETNGQFSPSSGSGYNWIYDSTCDVAYVRGYNDTINPICPPHYLATINNLNSAVTKTAAKTMKITYTLTEA